MPHAHPAGGKCKPAFEIALPEFVFDPCSRDCGSENVGHVAHDHDVVAGEPDRSIGVGGDHTVRSPRESNDRRQRRRHDAEWQVGANLEHRRNVVARRDPHHGFITPKRLGFDDVRVRSGSPGRGSLRSRPAAEGSRRIPTRRPRRAGHRPGRRRHRCVIKQLGRTYATDREPTEVGHGGDLASSDHLRGSGGLVAAGIRSNTTIRSVRIGHARTGVAHAYPPSTLPGSPRRLTPTSVEINLIEDSSSEPTSRGLEGRPHQWPLRFGRPRVPATGPPRPRFDDLDRERPFRDEVEPIVRARRWVHRRHGSIRSQRPTRPVSMRGRPLRTLRGARSTHRRTLRRISAHGRSSGAEQPDRTPHSARGEPGSPLRRIVANRSTTFDRLRWWDC